MTRVLIDIVHPAHVHFYRHMITALEEAGDDVLVVARQKDVTVRLLEEFGIDHRAITSHSGGGRAGQALELLKRDLGLARIARRFRPDLILTRNPAGVHVARLTRTIGVFDTDDGRAAGLHFRAAAPFASMITTPACLPEDYGRRHRRYPSYKALAYLHPDLFRPDPSVRSELGVGDEPFSIVRFVAMDASHDRHERGLEMDTKRELLRRLSQHGHVFVTSEGTIASEFEHLRFAVPPTRIHDALAFASLYVGDSQTMAAEAALLGTPSLRASSFTGRLAYLDELEHRYGLVQSFRPEASDDFLSAVDSTLAGDDAAQREEGRARMLSENVNLTDWYLELIRELTA